MKFYFAPLEGITGHVFRKIHHACFPGADKYFAPFISTKSEQRITSRDLKDLLPERNADIPLVPQILTNKSADCLDMLHILKELGYEEANLNFGCPSKTVVSKKKGSGILADTIYLNQFLYEVYEKTDMNLSIKTRTGMQSHEEMYRLMEIYNQYPLKELIVHPRLQADYYKNKPNLEIFRHVYETSVNPVCYNGDIFRIEDYVQLKETFPSLQTVMLGRGLLMYPGLALELLGKKRPEPAALKEFHDRIYDAYQEVLYGDRALLFKMKELWSYLIFSYPGQEKVLKKIRKAERKNQYEEAVKILFAEKE